MLSGGSGATGGEVRIMGGAGGPGGNVILEAGSSSSSSSGIVQVVGQALQVRPAGAGASSAASKLQLGTRADMSQSFTLQADDSQLSILNPLGNPVISFPASGPVSFSSGVTFGNQIQLTSSSGNAFFSASTSVGS